MQETMREGLPRVQVLNSS